MNEQTVPIAAALGSFERRDAHDRGVALLLMSDYGRAVHALEEAARLEPRNAAVYSDLSAAYFARGKARDYVPDYAAAIDAAEHAWRLERTPEIAWNRAVALSAFHVTAVAERTWEYVLSSEPDAEWRREAEQRLAALRQPTVANAWQQAKSRLAHEAGVAGVVKQFPAESLLELETNVLPRWARAELAGDAVEAARELAPTRAVAAALDAGGEHLPAGTMAAIDRACIHNDSCRAIAAAHALYDQAVHDMEAQSYRKAGDELTGAIAGLTRAGSPFAAAARLQLVVCLIHENRFADARTAAAALRVTVHGRYRTVEARTLWLQGLAMLHDARPEESIECYMAAAELFRKGNDRRNLAAVEVRLADALEYAGASDAAMTHRIAAFETMRAYGETTDLPLALFEAGSSVSKRGRLDAADLLLGESVREALPHRRFDLAAVASMWRSTLSSRKGDLTRAAEEARLAAIYTAETSDPGQRALIAANARRFNTATFETQTPLERLSETIDFFRAAGNRAWLPQLLRQRALLHRHDGDLAAAEADFRAAVGISEEILDDAAPAEMREGFTADARASYEDLVRLLLDRGAQREALSYAERARLIGRRGLASRDVLQPLASIPAGTTAVVYEIGADDVTVWLATRNSVAVFRSRDAADAAQRIASAMDAMPKGSALTALYDLLVKDWITNVPRGTHLVFVPSPALEGVPFAALADRRSQRALIDDYTVAVAFSLAAAAEPLPAISAMRDAVLIVGDPAYQRLPRLPRSRSEAIHIGRQYSRGTVLLDERASARDVMTLIEHAEIFHFAGHAVVNELAPELSSLMLAGENGDDGRLYVHEIPPHQPPLKLVVLSACSTARSRSGGHYGTLNLARAFVDRGARAVVGTLWRVSDDDAADFSIKLHEGLVCGESVARAVQSAQLQMKSRDRGDLTWTAFSLMKGNPASRR